MGTPESGWMVDLILTTQIHSAGSFLTLLSGAAVEGGEAKGITDVDVKTGSLSIPGRDLRTSAVGGADFVTASGGILSC